MGLKMIKIDERFSKNSLQLTWTHLELPDYKIIICQAIYIDIEIVICYANISKEQKYVEVWVTIVDSRMKYSKGFLT